MWGLVASVDAHPKFGLAGTMGTAALVIHAIFIMDFASCDHEFFFSIQIWLVYQKQNLFVLNSVSNSKEI